MTRKEETKKMFREMMSELPQPDTSKAWESLMKKRKKRLFRNSLAASILIVLLILTLSFPPEPVRAMAEFVKNFSVELLDETRELYQHGTTTADIDEDAEIQNMDEIVFKDLNSFSNELSEEFIVPENLGPDNFLKAIIYKIENALIKTEIYFLLKDKEVELVQVSWFFQSQSGRLIDIEDYEIKTTDIKINNHTIKDLHIFSHKSGFTLLEWDIDEIYYQLSGNLPCSILIDYLETNLYK